MPSNLAKTTTSPVKPATRLFYGFLSSRAESRRFTGREKLLYNRAVSKTVKGEG
jgi:hypothetical protein